MTTPPNPVDIRRSVRTICQKFGLDPALVRKIELTPRGAVVTIYKVNERGHKYIDSVTEQPATETLTFRTIA